MAAKLTASDQESFAYCSEMTRRLDEDRWLAAGYAPREERKRLHALYALHLEIERVPALVSEAPLGEIRLQFWRETIEEIEKGAPRAHPVARAAHSAAVLDAGERAAVLKAIDARARLLYDEPFTTSDELIVFLRRADSYLALLAARRLAPFLSGEQLDSIGRAALANALARKGRALAPELAADIDAIAADIHSEASGGLKALAPRAMPAAAHLTLTPRYIGGARPSPVTRRLRIFAAVAVGKV